LQDNARSHRLYASLRPDERQNDHCDNDQRGLPHELGYCNRAEHCDLPDFGRLSEIFIADLGDEGRDHTLPRVVTVLSIFPGLLSTSKQPLYLPG